MSKIGIRNKVMKAILSLVAVIVALLAWRGCNITEEVRQGEHEIKLFVMGQEADEDSIHLEVRRDGRRWISSYITQPRMEKIGADVVDPERHTFAQCVWIDEQTLNGARTIDVINSNTLAVVSLNVAELRKENIHEVICMLSSERESDFRMVLFSKNKEKQYGWTSKAGGDGAVFVEKKTER